MPFLTGGTGALDTDIGGRIPPEAPEPEACGADAVPEADGTLAVLNGAGAAFGAGGANDARTLFSISDMMSLFSIRKSRAFSRPWPSRVAPKDIHVPDFSMMFFSTARSITSPSREMPWLKSTSNSALRNGGAILFFTTVTRTRLPTISSPTLSEPMRRMSRRTDE